jgi:hypothetical protein
LIDLSKVHLQNSPSRPENRHLYPGNIIRFYSFSGLIYKNKVSSGRQDDIQLIWFVPVTFAILPCSPYCEPVPCLIAIFIFTLNMGLSRPAVLCGAHILRV